MFTKPAGAVQQGYQSCHALARSHYENFPVASRLLPAHLRNPVAAIYAFARTADDIADEGDASRAQRLTRLAEMKTALEAIESGTPPESPLFQALADSIARHALPLGLFHDLLSAFRQDVEKSRYAGFPEVMDYCRRSANPVGRLILHLFRQASQRNLALSDGICSALQLINFLQDVHQDFRENRRIYLPLDEMQRFGVTEDDIGQRRNSPQLRQLMYFQIGRAAKLLRSGSPLGGTLGGRLGLEIRAIILGGARILEKLHQQEDMFSRPRLNTLDRLQIAWGALRQQPL